ncbi:unnamed protein product [Parascedosporium putredinis]|uniref:Uncharacterized protein n=1 Tax=Parascedosporium putredinis TaxID=1442378 RepID=A0A9P1H913_9PEZI|nr:unnamed protein product [Parascedosporium putredinis]CAI8000376.1 unnamed protein product [Parascedosporium putredinis]
MRKRILQGGNDFDITTLAGLAVRLPVAAQAGDESSAGGGDADGEGDLDAGHVGHDDAGDIGGVEDGADGGGAGGDDGGGVDGGRGGGQLVEELVGEGGLAGGDAGGAAEVLEDWGDGRNVSGLSAALADNDGDLVSGTPAEAGEDLEADPAAGTGADIKSVDETGSDGGDGSTGNEDGHGAVGGGNEGTRGDHGNGNGDDEGMLRMPEVMGATPATLWNEEGGEEATDADGTSHDEAGHDDGALTHAGLPDDEGDGDDEETDEGADDDGGAPGLGLATLFESEHEADDGAHDEGSADDVHVEELFAPSRGRGQGGARGAEEEEDDGGGDAADGQVDVEAPTPGDAVGEDAAQQGPADGGDAVGQADEAGGRDEGDDGVGARTDAGGAKARDGAAEDEDDGVGGEGADEAADFEDEDGGEEGVLEAEEAVAFAPGGLVAAVGHEEGGAVPGDFVDAAELVGDFGDGGGDDGLRGEDTRELILRDQNGKGRNKKKGKRTMSREARKMLKMRARMVATKRKPVGYSPSSADEEAAAAGATLLSEALAAEEEAATSFRGWFGYEEDIILVS